MWTGTLYIGIIGLLHFSQQKPTGDKRIYDLSKIDDVTITSPGYDAGTYPHSIDVSWEFYSSTQHIEIIFGNFDVQYHANCFWDKVVIAKEKCDEQTNKDNSPMVLCGRLQPGAKLEFYSSHLCVTFHSSASTSQRRGFIATVSSPSAGTTAKVSKSETMEDNDHITTPSPGNKDGTEHVIPTEILSEINTSPSITTLSSSSSSSTPSTSLSSSPISPSSSSSEAVALAAAAKTYPSSSTSSASSITKSSLSHTSDQQKTTSPPLSSSTSSTLSSSTTSSSTTSSSSSTSTSTQTTTSSTSSPPPTSSSTSTTKKSSTSPSSTPSPSAPSLSIPLSSTSSSIPPSATTSSSSTPLSSSSHSTSSEEQTTVSVSQSTQTQLSSSSSAINYSSFTTSQVTPVTPEFVTEEIVMCEDLPEFIEMSDVESLSVRSDVDDAGKYPVNLHCVLTIHNSDQKAILIEFLELDLEYHHQCSWDYLEVNIHGEDTTKYCGNKNVVAIETLAPIIDVTFHSDHIVPDYGFHLKMSHIYEALTTQPAEVSENEVTISNTVDNSGSSPTITPYPGHNSNSSPIVTNQSSDNVAGVTTSTSAATTKYITIVDVVTSEGQYSELTSVPPEQATNAGTVSSENESNNVISVSDKVATTNMLTDKPSTISTPVTTSEVEPTIIDVCSEVSVVVDHPLALVTPGYNEEIYPLNKNCSMSLKANAKNAIMLRVDKFELEMHKKCSWDHVELQYNKTKMKLCGFLDSEDLTTYSACNPNRINVYDVNNSTSVCLFQSGTSVLINTEDIKVTFYSDYIINKKGFKINIQPLYSDNNDGNGNDDDPMFLSEDKSGSSFMSPSSSPQDLTSTSEQTSSIIVSSTSPSNTPLSTKTSLKPPSSLSSTSSTTQSSTSSSSTSTATTKTILKQSLTPSLTTSPSSSSSTSTKSPSPSSSSSTTSSSTQSPSLSSSSSSTSSTTQSTSPSSSSLTSSTTQSPSPSSSSSSSTSSTIQSPSPSSSSSSTSSTTQSTSPSSSSLTSSTTQSTSPSQSSSTSSSSSTFSSSSSSPTSSTTPSSPLVVSTDGVPTTQQSNPSSSSVTSVNVPVELVVVDACSGDSPQILDSETGFIQSPGYHDGEYPKNSLCKWKLTGDKPQVIMIIFETFDVEYSPECMWDKLTIYEIQQDEKLKRMKRFCGSTIPGLVTFKTDILIEFTSDSITEKSGFRLQYYKIETNTDVSYSCEAGMIPCLNDGKCIPVEWWCDNMEDCEDGTDESSCNLCKDDELQCINGTCIKSKQRCDGIKDCPYGTDERSCVSISDENLPVMINIQNKWSPLCYDDQVADRDDQLCNAAGYRSSTDLMVQDNQYYDLYSKIQTGDESLQFSSSPICQDQKTVRLQCSETDCGQNGEHLRNKRIVGGNIAMKGSWPWSVAVRIGNNVVCGGSIISDRWVVTAGHCVHDLEDNPQVLSVIAGVNDIEDDTSEVRYISEVINHPQYNYIFHADIALLRLESPLIFNKDIQPICLPWDRRQFSPLDICFVTGYGVSNMTHYYTTITPRYLRQVKTKIIDQQLCETMYSYKSIITDSMLCAGYTSGGMDTCKGDSGGGLMCQNEDGRWLLAGVISWGDLCGSRNRPGVYTNILSFIDWIGDQTNPNVVHNVTCDFEQNWCGYQPVSTGKHIWTRKPGDKYVKGRVLVAAPTSSSSPSSFPGNTPTNVSLFSPTFTLTSDNCLSLTIMFSRNSQITVTVYGKTAVTQTDQSGTTGQADTVLFKMTSSYPAMNVWKSVEINIPSTIGQFVMVSDLYYGSISEVGLDNITMVPGMCQGSNIMDCDFDDATLCFYSQSFGDNKIQWEISHDTDGNHLKTGGDSEDFGYQTVSQLISPVVASDFISIPHCLTFTYNKITNTKTELVISTYITIVGELANPHVYWTSESSPIGTWRTQNVTIAHDIFDHVVFEVRRIDFSTDRVEILLDDIKFVDGICV